MRFPQLRPKPVNPNPSRSSSAAAMHPWRRPYSDRPHFVTGDDHFQSITNTNDNIRIAGQFRPWPHHRHPPPPHFYPPQLWPQRPADFREWKFVKSPPPPGNERFTVVSYNILADYLAMQHRPELYYHVPWHVLDWERRKRRLIIEFGLWNPDILCLQEVDRFHDINQALASRGYTGIWKMRTGNAIDGCAVFWRTNRFLLRYEESIEFNKHGLRDNVAQICVLESGTGKTIESTAAPLPTSFDQPKGSNQIIICNIHVLYNPKRGEIKLGQVRVLLERAYAISRNWNDAPVILCGDFNSTPRSPLYNFIAEQKLSLSGLTRDQVSGQYSASSYPPRPYADSSLYRTQSTVNRSSEIASTEQGHSTGSPMFCALQRDVGNNVSPAKVPLSQTPTGVLPMDTQSCSVSQCTTGKDTQPDANANENGETYVRDDQCPPRGIIRSSSERSGIHLNMGNNGKEQTPAVSCSADPYMEDIQHEHGSEVKNTAELFKEDASVDQQNATADETCRETCTTNGNYDSERMQSLSCNIAVEEVVGGMSAYEKRQYDSATKLSSDGISEYEVNFASGDRLQKDQLDGSTTVGQVDNEIGDLCHSEENPDPDFFKDLLGTEDATGYREEANIEINSTCLHKSTPDSSSTQVMEDCSSLNGPPSANQENNFYRPYNPYLWTPMEIEVASGKSQCPFVEHNLKLRSAYTDVEDFSGTKDSSGEPQVTSYHRKFMGTVDYIWYSEGLRTVKVLDTIPKHVLQRTPGFPTQKWGSDHIALACEFSFTKV